VAGLLGLVKSRFLQNNQGADQLADFRYHHIPVNESVGGDGHRWFQCLTAKRIYRKPLLVQQHHFSPGKFRIPPGIQTVA